MQTDDRDPNAYYQSKLGVAFYDLFSGDAPPAYGKEQVWVVRKI
jgi:hypothetical protein